MRWKPNGHKPWRRWFKRNVRVVRGRKDLWDSGSERRWPQKSFWKTSESGVLLLCVCVHVVCVCVCCMCVCVCVCVWSSHQAMSQVMLLDYSITFNLQHYVLNCTCRPLLRKWTDPLNTLCGCGLPTFCLSCGGTGEGHMVYGYCLGKGSPSTFDCTGKVFSTICTSL